MIYFQDRVEAALRALFMAPLSHFTGKEFPDGRNTDRCYPGSGLVCKMTPCGAAITAMENKLKIERRGLLGERLRRIQHRIENGPAPVHLVVDSLDFCHCTACDGKVHSRQYNERARAEVEAGIADYIAGMPPPIDATFWLGAEG